MEFAPGILISRNYISAIDIVDIIQEKYGPIGLIHLDAHADTNDSYNGFKITHGTPFRRAVEEGLLGE